MFNQLDKWPKLIFEDWREKLADFENQHYCMRVALYRYESERMRKRSPTSGPDIGRIFEIGITDFEGTAMTDYDYYYYDYYYKDSR